MANIYFKVLKDNIIKNYTDEPICDLQIELMKLADSKLNKGKLIINNERN